IRWFLDLDGAVSRLYGASASDDAGAYRRLWVVLDPGLRVLAVLPFSRQDARVAELAALIKQLPPPARHTGAESFPPVLVLPNVLERELCQTLVSAYQADGGRPSGFMRDIDGKTVLVEDHSHKRRRDFIVEDAELIASLQQRVHRRIVPEIAKA